MGKIKLKAYFAKNLGDDLMIHTLLTRYPQHTFWSDLSTPDCDLFLRYPNFENHSQQCKRWGKLARMLHVLSSGRLGYPFLDRLSQKRTHSCQASVMIGGSMFIQQDQISPQDRLAQELRDLSVCPRFVIGANFGPYQTEGFKEAFHSFFETCEGVTFRDRYSYDLFSQLPCVDYAPDVVLSMDVSHLRDRVTNDTVVISVIDPSHRPTLCPYTDTYYDFIRSLCRSCLEQDRTPVLMSFCETEGDMRAISQILSGLSEEDRRKVQIHDYQGDLDAALAVLADCEKIIATRFHAMILALLLEKPFFCISYSDKSRHFLDDLGCDAYCPIDALHTLRAEEILAHGTTVVDASSAIRASHEQFSRFERYMSHG